MKKLLVPIFVLLASVMMAQEKALVSKMDGENYKYPFAGGMNASQFCEVDMDMDGIRDLLVFDRQGNRLMPYINNGTAGEIDYSFAPEYISEFPEFSHWVMFTDYNMDGKNDIFAYNPAQPGIIVYRNTSQATLRFELEVYPYLTSWYGSGYVNILVTYADYPGISDLDNDGDLDIITFWALGSFVEMHRNLSMETYGHADSLIFERTTWCWGEFAENEESNALYLDTCFGNKYLHPSDITGKERHTGSTLLLYDMDNNGTKDLLLGDVDYPQLVYLHNDGTPGDAYMDYYELYFPDQSNPSWIYSMPAAALIDVNNDSKKDLLASPFDPNPFVTQNHRSAWMYLNEGSNEFPSWTISTKGFLQEDMIDVGSGAYPVFADINLDGLQDLIVGNYGYYQDSWYDEYMTLYSEYAGRMAIFLNTGDNENPVFEFVTDNFGHIHEMNILGPYPAFGDIDSDDDADMIVGRDDGKLMFYRNCSCLGNPEDFDLEDTNYMDIDVGEFSTPFIYDMDEDGLLDLIIGERGGNINYYRNTGNEYEPEFTLVTDSLGKVLVTDFNLSYDGYSTPYVFRASDGKMRLLSGSEQGTIFCYTEIEGNLEGAFTPADVLWQEVDSLEFEIRNGYRTSAAIANLNGDEYLDLMVGNFSGGLELYGTLNAPEVSMDITEYSSERNILSIYPNPSSDQAIIDVAGGIPEEAFHISVYSVLGKAVKEEIVTSLPFALDVNGIPEGIYLLSLWNDKGWIASGRLVIVR